MTFKSSPGKTDSFEAAPKNKYSFEYKTKTSSNYTCTHAVHEYITSTNSSEVDAYEANTAFRKTRALFARKDSKALLHMP